MSGEMAVAYFLSHAPRGFFPILNSGDGAILYCFIFLYLVFAGAGPCQALRMRSRFSTITRRILESSFALKP